MKKTLKYHQTISFTIVKEDKDIIKYGTEPPKPKVMLTDLRSPSWYCLNYNQVNKNQGHRWQIELSTDFPILLSWSFLEVLFDDQS